MIVTEKVNQVDRYLNVTTTERFKKEYFRDSNVIASQQSKLADKENNDCVVRAFMCALDITYDQAHAYIKKEMKRVDRKGTYTSAYAKNVVNTVKNNKKIHFIGTHPSKAYINNMVCGNAKKKILANNKYYKPTGFTLKSFIECNPIGRFVLIVQGHAVAIVNGVLFGNATEQYHGIYRSVWYGFEMREKTIA
jgi:hypothetical protein